MAGRNFLVIMMDELSLDGVGCYGGTAITPNIDRLAARGCRFTNAYTPSPICVPARAAFQSGHYVFQNRCWSNAEPYTGNPTGWAHRLKADGHRTVSIGKLHYRCGDDDNGYAEEIVPLHVHNGEGWVYGLLRRQDHTAYDSSHFAERRGPGEDSYSDYDRRVRDATVNWLQREAGANNGKPWALFVSFLRPHYPLTCPQPFFDLYPLNTLPPIRFTNHRNEFRHPVLNAFRQYNDYDNYFPDDTARQVARASYFGLCSFVDDLVGDVLKALDDTGHSHDTVVALTSDHGEQNGHHGLWTKMAMYEDSIAIPMLLSGPGISPSVCATQCSLIDIHQSALEATGLGLADEDTALAGRSLLQLAGAPTDLQRAVFSEYHDGGAITGYMVLREGRWKYVAYAGFAPQLFDLQTDPFEQSDLGLSAEHEDIRRHLHGRMVREFGDPESISARAFADQERRIAELGGIEGIRRRANYDHTPVG